MTKMQRSWLVQRLEKPRPSATILGRDNPFAFGGGLRNGGLSGDAMDLLRPIFSFDYMGAAEFEFGALPEALNLVRAAAVEGDLIAGTLSIPLASVAKNFRDKTRKPPTGDVTVYVLCRRDHEAQVRERITGWAAEPYEANLKEATRLSSTLRPYNEFDGEVVGWLELDNGFFFFADQAMWSATAALFGVDVEAEVPA